MFVILYISVKFQAVLCWFERVIAIWFFSPRCTYITERLEGSTAQNSNGRQKRPPKPLQNQSQTKTFPKKHGHINFQHVNYLYFPTFYVQRSQKDRFWSFFVVAPCSVKQPLHHGYQAQHTTGDGEIVAHMCGEVVRSILCRNEGEGKASPSTYSPFSAFFCEFFWISFSRMPKERSG